METFFIIIISILVTLGVITLYKQFRTKIRRKEQSIILIEKIKRVCKFITVEGDFSEIYHYEDVKEKFLKLITSKKKALVVINAKAHVGFDLRKLKMDANPTAKRLVLMDFPQPEFLSIETNMNYYDKQEGVFNKFEATDLTELSSKAKIHIEEKIPESGLLDIAKGEALNAIQLIESIVQTIGWTLDYSALELSEAEKTLLDETSINNH